MKDIGRITKKMVKEDKFTQTGMFMKVILLIIKQKVKEFIITMKMEVNIREIEFRIINRVKE